ncbi:hypothetical protein SEPCBS119000_002505 [Sporothrix epigloea]|uniref:Aminoglycoside phosphotransferase domain-containing protein n=1 Tax=Sporothrix epigloea TaxID=1892477 RepID=A0ABP0DGI5_9PEZI
MDRVAGQSLDKLWDGFDTTQKMEIVKQLKESFAAIRDLPDSGFFGSIDKTKMRDFFFLIDQYLPSIHGPVDAKSPDYYSEENRKLRSLRMKKPVPSIEGPFDTEEALINGLLERFLAQDPERRRYTTEHYRIVLFKVLECSSRPIFTHGDLQLKNIMLQPNGRIVIIDWATSGWYPVYWEAELINDGAELSDGRRMQ